MSFKPRPPRVNRRVRTCRHPDRDSPKLLCGHPIPSDAALNRRETLTRIAEALDD
jgi:hypothetical protein